MDQRISLKKKIKIYNENENTTVIFGTQQKPCLDANSQHLVYSENNLNPKLITWLTFSEIKKEDQIKPNPRRIKEKKESQNKINELKTGKQ